MPLECAITACVPTDSTANTINTQALYNAFWSLREGVL